MAARENVAYKGHPKVEELRYGWGREIAEEERRNLLANRDRSHEDEGTGAFLSNNNRSNNNNNNNNSNRGIISANNRSNNNGSFTQREGDGDDRSQGNWSRRSDRDNLRPAPSPMARAVGWVREILRLSPPPPGR